MFVAALKWLERILQEEKIHNFLAKHHINWQFHLSRAPWWGVNFERIIGLTKKALFKGIENMKLTWKELESALLDIEITLYNRPLGHIEDNIHTPILIPSLMILGQPNFGLECDVGNTEDCDLKKRATVTHKIFETNSSFHVK